MPFHSLDITNFRVFDRIGFKPCDHINLFIGDNGSGKTSVIEAIYSLARGRTFRSRYHKPVIRDGCSSSVVFSNWLSNDGSVSKIGIERTAGSTRVRVNGSDIARLSYLGSLIPLQLITPQSVHTFSATPSIRRKLLDWGVFHVEPSFNLLWNSFNKILKQRNAAIRRSERRTAHAFDSDFYRYALGIDKFRERHFQLLKNVFSTVIAKYSLFSGLEITYRRGWNKSKDLSNILEDINSDLKNGYTQSGPQYSDLIFTVDGKPIKDILSNGEQKLVAFLFKISQVQILNDYRPNETVLLLDDIYSELSYSNRDLVNTIICDTSNQIFITSPDAYLCNQLSSCQNNRVFHVEHGSITSV